MNTAKLSKLSHDLQTHLGTKLKAAWSKQTVLHESYLTPTEAESISDRIIDIVTLTGIRSECIRLSHHGSAVPTLDYVKPGQVGAWTVPDLIDHHRLTTIINEKQATLLVDGLDLYDDDFASLREALSFHFNSTVDLSAILTPRWTKGLSIHIDSEDVIVLQLKGTKDWNIHQPVDFTFHQGRGIQRAELTRKERAVRLQAGDLLYVPRGAPHVAASGGEGSIHLAIAIERPTFSSLVKGSQHDSPIPGEVGYGRAAHSQFLKSTTHLDNDNKMEPISATNQYTSSVIAAKSLRSLIGPLNKEAFFTATTDLTVSDSNKGSVTFAVNGKQVSIPKAHAEPLRIVAAGKPLPATSVSNANSVYLDQLIRLGLVNVVTDTK